MSKLLEKRTSLSSFSDLTDMQVTGGFQMSGLLLKKPMGRPSNKWSKRFFVLKDSFMFYYGETEKKIFDTKVFNIHPKGVIPLGDCMIEEATLPNLPFGIRILPANADKSDASALYLGADDEDSKQEWIRAIEQSSKITTLNAELSETMIRSLQEQLISVSKERQELFEKFIRVSEEFGAERAKTEELEAFNFQLAEEKVRIQMFVDELQDTQETIKIDLEDTLKNMELLETERHKMLQITVELQGSIQRLSQERETILSDLEEQKRNDEVKSDEATKNVEELMQKLDGITKQTQEMEEQKTELEKLLSDNEQEKAEFRLTTEVLSHEIQDLEQERCLMQEEAKAENEEKQKLSMELEHCKIALKRLQIEALHSKENEDINDQVMTDVKSLLGFFESCAEKSKLEIQRNQLKRKRMSQRLSRKRNRSLSTRMRSSGKYYGSKQSSNFHPEDIKEDLEGEEEQEREQEEKEQKREQEEKGQDKEDTTQTVSQDQSGDFCETSESTNM
ncbi:uncharacterized protein LOC100179678 [Ciona intestinalis]